MRVHLTNMGLHTIGNLAQYPVKWLQKRWGLTVKFCGDWQMELTRALSYQEHIKRKSNWAPYDITERL